MYNNVLSYKRNYYYTLSVDQIVRELLEVESNLRENSNLIFKSGYAPHVALYIRVVGSDQDLEPLKFDVTVYDYLRGLPTSGGVRTLSQSLQECLENLKDSDVKLQRFVLKKTLKKNIEVEQLLADSEITIDDLVLFAESMGLRQTGLYTLDLVAPTRVII